MVMTRNRGINYHDTPYADMLMMVDHSGNSLYLFPLVVQTSSILKSYITTI